MRADLRSRARSQWRRRFGWEPYPATVWPRCAICGSRERATVGRRVASDMRYRNVVCRDCGLVYICPRPTETAFEDFYERLYPRAPEDEAPTERGVAVASFLQDEVDLSRHTGVFDIGCGGGGILRAFARAPQIGRLSLGGCDPVRLSTGRTVIDEGGTPIEIFKAHVEAMTDELEPYSIFVLYDVIEHLLAPGDLLDRLHERTNAGAVLFVSTNALDNWREIPRGGWETYYLRLAHTYTFTKSTLDALLRGHGWRPIRARDAPKGDQWVLASRAEPDPNALAAAPGHCREVLALIASYREWDRRRADVERLANR